MLRAVNQNFPKLRRLRSSMWCAALICAVTWMTGSADEAGSNGALAAYVASPHGAAVFVTGVTTVCTRRAIPESWHLTSVFPESVTLV